MDVHDQLVRARQDDLLRQAERYRVAAAARRVRRHRRAVTHRPRLWAAWTTAKPVPASARASRSEAGAR